MPEVKVISIPFSQICERTNPNPIDTFVPHQALDLKTLIQRFERGQRLNVHQNFTPMSNMTSDSLYVEDFEEAPPDNVHDIVDVESHYRAHQEHKADYNRRKKESKRVEDAPKDDTKQDPIPVESNPSE